MEYDALLDAARNRIWLIRNDPHQVQHVAYMDLADNKTWKQINYSNWPDAAIGAVFSRCMLHEGYIIRNCGPTYGLWLFDPDSPATSGWQQLTVTGTLPSSLLRWAPYNGKWYSIPNSGGTTLTRITPPADPKTGTWIVDTVTVSGVGSGYGAGGYEHYTRLSYVPSIDCLAWIPGLDASGAPQGVWILRPE